MRVVWYDGSTNVLEVMGMYCPNCNMPRPNDIRFCSDCGAELLAPPKPKKGKLWPPILFMVIMMVAGSVLYAMTRPQTSSPSPSPWFTVEDGILSFHRDSYTGGNNLEIPATVDGQKVTALEKGCFQDFDLIETVTLPDTLESIGDQAFLGCDHLRAVKLTENVQVIGKEAFSNCPALEAMYIPQSVQTVGDNAFSACNQFKCLFFAGTLEEWNQLYPQGLGSSTQIYGVSGPDADSYQPL